MAEMRIDKMRDRIAMLEAENMRILTTYNELLQNFAKTQRDLLALNADLRRQRCPFLKISGEEVTFCGELNKRMEHNGH